MARIKRPVGFKLDEDEWRWVVGYEGHYEVSNSGKVRSVDRKVRQELKDGSEVYRSLKGADKKFHVDKDGYSTVGLCKEGTCKTEKVHRLVAAAFIPNPEDNPCVNHMDGNKQNNKVSNLEWCTILTNNTHSIEKGLRKVRGEYRYNTVLNNDSVMEICRLLDETSLTQSEIGSRFGVSNLVVSRINTGYTWNWLTKRREKDCG